MWSILAFLSIFSLRQLCGEQEIITKRGFTIRLLFSSTLMILTQWTVSDLGTLADLNLIPVDMMARFNRE